jgi:hypothetical protein
MRVRRLIASSLFLIAAQPLHAAPQVLPLGEPDKHGAITYSVKCDNGAKKILQCVRDDRHCGYAGDQTLASLIDEACGAKSAPAAPSAGDEAPFQTSPAAP